MRDSVVRNFCRFVLVLALAAPLVGTVGAETLHLTDGQTFSGEVVQMDDKGVVLKQANGSYTDHIPWAKLSQSDLRALQENPKAAPFVEPFVELTQEDKIKRTEIEIKDFPHLQRQTNHSLIAGMFTTPIGIFCLLVLYAGNIYAGYEISIFRGRPAGMVCGVSAVAPVIGPIIFLSMPPPVATHGAAKKAEEWQPPAEEYADAGVAAAIAADQAAAVASGQEAPAAAAGQAQAYAHAPSAASALPPTKTFLRGQYTFNRRFFETQMPTFFGITRSGPDKEMVLSIRSSRGSYIGQRISRISANELHLQVTRNNASEEVIIPFVEIQEVQIKHKDA